MSFTLNPITVTNARGLFYTQSEGFVQGSVEDDPAARFAIKSGVAAASQTLTGGYPVTITLPLQTSQAPEFRAVLTLDTGTANNIQGWTVFNQSAALIQTPQQLVPSAQAGMGINYVLNGSGVRIALGVNQAAATALANAAIIGYSTLYWDNTNLIVTTTSASNIPLPTTYTLVDLDVLGNSLVASSTLAWTTGYCAVFQI